METVEWGESTVFSEHGISHGRAVAPTTVQLALSVIEGPVHNAWWARIAPGGFIIPHIDAGPFLERWHFPVLIAGMFWEDGVHSQPTEPFAVHHWKPHAVYNATDDPRVHLIVDREVVPPEAPLHSELIFTDMIPEVSALIP